MELYRIYVGNTFKKTIVLGSTVDAVGVARAALRATRSTAELRGVNKQGVKELRHSVAYQNVLAVRDSNA